MKKDVPSAAAGLVADDDFLEDLFVDDQEDASQTLGRRMRAALEKRRAQIFSGDSDGVRIASTIAQDNDALVARLYRQAAPGDEMRIALVAVGGYGRGVAAPYSDIDLLILHDDAPSGALDDFVRALLYPLWDAGFTVGQAVHTPASAMKLVAKDVVMCTSFLDRRFLIGDKALFDEFDAQFERRRAKTKPAFTKAKLAEQVERRDSLSHYGRYTEPHIKEGRGGLRDIDIIDWLHAYNFEESVWSLDGASSLLGAADVAALNKARRFLLSVRVHLHHLLGRSTERVSFDIQPALAERLGYRARKGRSEAERLMTHYALVSEDVGRLGRLAALRLEEMQARLSDWRPSPTPKMLQTDEVEGRVNIRMRTGRLDFASPARARERPIDLFRLFRALARKKKYEIHPNAASLVTEAAAAFPREERDDPDIATVFVATLLNAKAPGRVLRLMSLTGLLGKYIPLFDRLAGRVEYGLYRQYSFDRHIFLAMDVLADVRNGALASDHPIATQILREHRRKLPFYLSVLLQETDSTVDEETPDATEALVREVCILLNARPAEADAVAAVVTRLSLFIRTATRRSLGDAAALIAFCREIQSRDRLDYLLVLAVCRLRVIREDAWDDWTRVQITSLYAAARAYLEDGEDGLSALRQAERSALTKALKAAAPDWPAARLAPLIDTVAESAAGAIPVRLLARATQTWRAAVDEGEPDSVSIAVEKNSIEAVVYARDREGLLADLAGAVAAAGASVRTVQAITLDDHSVIDVFVLRAPEDADGAVNAAFLKSLEAALRAAARAAPDKPPAPARRIGDKRKVFRVPPAVRVDLDASEDCLVVEAEGLDRPGLLRDLAQALADIGVLIKSAHVATYGEKAIDVFYLQDAPGYKITNKRRIESIKRRLIAALRDGC